MWEVISTFLAKIYVVVKLRELRDMRFRTNYISNHWDIIV